MTHIAFYICLLFLLSSCATVVPPSGGEKDSSPPKLLSVIPENQTINFNGNSVTLFFDEFIQLKNKSEINFFPEIQPRPSIKIKGKSIIIEFLTELKLNTTHIINFNSTIIDLNESNPLQNFQYVFSTGNMIDTCKLNGLAFDLISNQKSKDVIVGLFKNKLIVNYDSLVRTSSPDYFVFSDQIGNYNFSNLKKGNYILYAFKDLNLSKKYEEQEPISMPIMINVDGNQTFDIPLFIEDRFLKKNTLNCFYQQTKKDTSSTGSINLNFKKEIYESNKYIGELILRDSSVFCFNINSNIINIDSLLVGIYSFRMFEDLNKNNLWDSGNIKSLTSPEKLKFFNETIDVKKDWEIDVFIE